MAPALRSSRPSSISPKAKGPLQHHHSYLQMVTEATVSLRQRWGSSLRELTEFVGLKHGTRLPSNFPAKVKRRVRQMARQGILQTTHTKPMKYRLGKMLRSTLKPIIMKNASLDMRFLTSKYIAALCPTNRSCNGDAFACCLPSHEIIFEAKDQIRDTARNKGLFLSDLDCNPSKELQDSGASMDCDDDTHHDIIQSIHVSQHEIVLESADLRFPSAIQGSFDDTCEHRCYGENGVGHGDVYSRDENAPERAQYVASAGRSDERGVNEDVITHLTEEENANKRKSDERSADAETSEHVTEQHSQQSCISSRSLQHRAHYDGDVSSRSQARHLQTKRIRVIATSPTKMKIKRNSFNGCPKPTTGMPYCMQYPISSRNRPSKRVSNSRRHSSSKSSTTYSSSSVWRRLQQPHRQPITEKRLCLSASAPSGAGAYLGAFHQHGVIRWSSMWRPYTGGHPWPSVHECYSRGHFQPTTLLVRRSAPTACLQFRILPEYL